MKTIQIIIALLLCVPAFAQDARVNRQDALALKTAKAYEAKAEAKVKELFNYLELLTDPKGNPEMKAHVRDEIEKLFNGEVMMPNFFSKKSGPTNLNDVLDKAVQAKEKYTFTITDFSITPQSGTEKPEMWMLGYTVKFLGGMEVTVLQPFYIVQENKQFGAATRKVTNTYLGSMKQPHL